MRKIGELFTKWRKFMDKKSPVFWSNEQHKTRLIEELRGGRVVISSTDTIFGFLGPCTKEAHVSICNLKGGRGKKPFIILISSIDKLWNFVDKSKISDQMLQFVTKCWPGPVTFVFDAKPGLPDYLVSGATTIALRCPNHAGLLSVLPHFDGLFSTSANRSVDPFPKRFEDINPEVLAAVPLCIINERGVATNVESTIVDVSQQKNGRTPFTVLRQGAFSLETLKEIYEEVSK